MSEETCNTRFRAERLRLGYPQQLVAEEAGVSKRSVVSWEGTTSIPADKLERLASVGFDVQFVVTGVRSANTDQVSDHPSRYEPSTAEELRLLRLFRAMPDEARDRALGVIKALAVAEGIQPAEAMRGQGQTTVITGGKRVAGNNLYDMRTTTTKGKRGKK